MTSEHVGGGSIGWESGGGGGGPGGGGVVEQKG